MVSEGFPISVIAKNARNSILDKILRNLRLNNGVNTIWRSDTNQIKQIKQILNNGEIVAALIDQDTNVTNLNIPFLNKTASTPSSIIKIAKKYNVPIFAAFLVRNNQYRYEIKFKRIDETKSIDEILLEYNLILQNIIQKNPEQWFGSIKDGEPMTADIGFHQTNIGSI